MLKQYQADILSPQRFMLGEGPVYHKEDNSLWFVDIHPGALHVWDIAAGAFKRKIKFGQSLGAAVPTTGGRVLAALTTGVYLYDDDTGLRPVCRPAELTANLRLNDAKCDPAGRFWFGTAGTSSGFGEDGSLFCLYPTGGYLKAAGGVTTSNGLGWSPDNKTMYYIDTPTNGVDAFDYDIDTGLVRNRRRVYTSAKGGPDGMTVDAEGMLWVALWGGDRVVRVDPATGGELAEVPLPAHHVTSCCFGGPGLDTLFITSSGEDFDNPEAGCVFVLQPGVTGMPPAYFDDSTLG